MKIESAGRRDFLRQAGLMGSIAMMTGLPEGALAVSGLGESIVEDARTPAQPEQAPKHHINFAVCGISHDHIYGMVGAVQRGGGKLVAAWGAEEDKLAQFSRRYPEAKMVATQEEIF